MALPREGGGNVPRPKVKSKPNVAPRPDSSVQAPKPKVRRGKAPTVFTESPIRNPIERMQTKQARVSARAIQNAAHAESGPASGLGKVPKAPNRPLTNREAARFLSSPQAANVEATVPKPKAPKAHHFKVAGLPLGAMLADVPAELKGAGAIEGAITRLGAASAEGWKMVPVVGHEAGNIVKDTSGVVAGAVPSVAIPTSEVLTGHPGKAVSTIASGIKQTVEHPAQHPVSLLLIARGGEGAVSRGAGEALRLAPKGSKLAEYAATKDRMPVSLGGTAMETRRRSKGLVENRAQVALDKRQARKMGTTTIKVPVHDGEGKLQYTAKVEALNPTQGQLKNLHVVGGKLNRRIDQEAGKFNGRMRDLRTKAHLVMHHAKPNHEDAVAMVNEGVIKTGNEHRPMTADTIREDLQNHLDQLQAERDNLDQPAHVRDNAENIAQVERLLANKKFLNNPVKEVNAADKYATASRLFEQPRIKYGDLTKGQADRRTLLPFAVREMGLVFNKEAKRFETPEGKPVSNEAIIREFEARGGNTDHLAYVPSKPDFLGSKNFYGSGLRRPGAESKRFTGEAIRTGAYARNYDVLTQQLSNSAVKVARHESINNLTNNFVMKQANGEWFDAKGADAEKRNIEAATGEKYVPITVARQSAPDTLIEDLNPEEFKQTFREAEPGDSHVGLIREQVWNRLQEHEQGRGRNAAVRGFQQATQTFRHVVLSTSTKWLAGNGLEAYLRMQINELSPMQVAATIEAGRRIEKNLKALGPGGEKAAGELRATSAEGMFLSQHSLDLHQPESKFMAFAQAVRQAGLGPGHVVGPKGIVDLWDKYRAAVTAFNGGMERSVYYYAIGKEARQEVGQFTSAWDRALRKAGPAYEDVAKGLLDSNKIAQYARAVDDIRGRYSNLSPSGRFMVTTYTPFGPWYVNSLHFFAITLPGHHPFKTGVLAAAAVGTQAERKKLDLPPWAQGVPLGGGKVLPIQHFLPTGAFENGPDVSSLVLPQVTDIGKNLAGLSWNNVQLPKGTNRIALALNTAAGSFLPFYDKVQTVLERGGKPQANSTLFSPHVKKGTATTLVAGLKKAVAPIREQNTAKAVTTKSKSSSDPLFNSASTSKSDPLFR